MQISLLTVVTCMNVIVSASAESTFIRGGSANIDKGINIRSLAQSECSDSNTVVYKKKTCAWITKKEKNIVKKCNKLSSLGMVYDLCPATCAKVDLGLCTTSKLVAMIKSLEESIVEKDSIIVNNEINDQQETIIADLSVQVCSSRCAVSYKFTDFLGTFRACTAECQQSFYGTTEIEPVWYVTFNNELVKNILNYKTTAIGQQVYDEEDFDIYNEDNISLRAEILELEKLCETRGPGPAPTDAPSDDTTSLQCEVDSYLLNGSCERCDATRTNYGTSTCGIVGATNNDQCKYPIGNECVYDLLTKEMVFAVDIPEIEVFQLDRCDLVGGIENVKGGCGGMFYDPRNDCRPLDDPEDLSKITRLKNCIETLCTWKEVNGSERLCIPRN